MANRVTEGLAWLHAALAQPIEDFPWLRVMTYLSASVATSNQDPKAALAYAGAAVQLAEASTAVIDVDVIKALGELAIASWNAGDRDSMADALHRAGEKLFILRKVEMETWQALTVAFGGVVSALAALVTGRKTATAPGVSSGVAVDGITTPQPGTFAWLAGGLTSRYNDAQDAVVCASMVEILASLGHDDQAAEWLNRGYAMAEATCNALARSQLDIAALPTLLADDRCADALDRAREASRTMTALANSSQRPSDPMPKALDVQATLGDASPPLQRRAEEGALDLALPLICCRLARLRLADQECARTVAGTVIARCHDLSASAAAPDRWRAAADLLDTIFVRDRSLDDLVEMLDALDGQAQSLGVVARIGATLQAGAPLPQSCALHIRAVRDLYHFRAFVPGAYRRLALPFVFTYWTDKLATQGFKFRQPQFLKDQLAQARDRPPEVQAQWALREVARGLGIQVSSDTWEW